MARLWPRYGLDAVLDRARDWRGQPPHRFEIAGQAAGTGAEHVMVISPAGAINPGETKTMNLTLRDPVWRDTRMIEVNRPRIEVAGQLLFQDPSGTQSQTTVASSVNPKLI